MSDNKKHSAHLYGISERIVKKIILECLDDKLLFDKLEDEISDFINSGAVDSKINELIQEKIDELRQQILDGVIEDYDTLKEIAEWINNHQDLYETLVNIVNETVRKSEFEDRITILQNNIDNIQQLLSDTQNDLNDFKLNQFAIGEYIDDEIQLKNIDKNEHWYPITKVSNIIGLSDLINETTKPIYDEILSETNRATAVENKLQLDLTTLREDWEESLTNTAIALDLKVDWSDGNKNKIVLPNHGQIVGISNEDELEFKYNSSGNASLLMLSKWNVVDLGSIKYPINLNGPENLKPTYNNNPLALLSDVTDVNDSLTIYIDSSIQEMKEELLGSSLAEIFETLKEIEDWAIEHGLDYSSLVLEVSRLHDKLFELKCKLKNDFQNIENILEQNYVKNVIFQTEIEDIKNNYVTKEENKSKLDKNIYEEYIKEQQKIIEDLKTRIDTLENKEYSNVKADVMSTKNNKIDAIFGGMGIQIIR